MPRQRAREDDDYDDKGIIPRNLKKKHGRKSPGYLMALLIGGLVLGFVVLAGAVAAFVSATRNNGGGPAPQELQGTWKMISLETNGRTRTDQLPTDRVVFTDGVMTSYGANGSKYNSPIRVNPNRAPKELDVIDKGFTYPAIYKIEGDTLTICINEIFASRPNEFSSRALSGSGGVAKYLRVTPESSGSRAQQISGKRSIRGSSQLSQPRRQTARGTRHLSSHATPGRPSPPSPSPRMSLPSSIARISSASGIFTPAFSR